MQNFESIKFIWTGTHRESFKSSLVYPKASRGIKKSTFPDDLKVTPLIKAGDNTKII